MKHNHNHGLEGADAYAAALESVAAALDAFSARMRTRIGNDERGFSSPLYVRRAFAAPSHGVFFFGESLTRGVNAPLSFMGEPCGRLSSLPFPYMRSANPHGAAHPLAGVCGGYSKHVRTPAMQANRTNGQTVAVNLDHPNNSLTAKAVEAFFTRGLATLPTAHAIADALDEITLQTLGALNAAAIGRTDTLVSLPRDAARDIEALLVGLRRAVGLAIAEAETPTAKDEREGE